MRVLVAEDVEDLATAIAAGLRREGMAVDVVLDGTSALDHLAVTGYDVVVLDRDLPGTHGDEVCRSLAASGSMSRVLMLTAASTIRDRVEGLGLGADDYLPKPFDFAELVARIRALGRRSAPSLPPVLERSGVSLDPGRRVAFRAGRRLELSPKEFGLLEYLLAAGDQVVSAEELLERVWDEAADPFTTAVKQTMRRLRVKLGNPPVIRTVREGGYQIGPMLCVLCAIPASWRPRGACPGAPCGRSSPCSMPPCSAWRSPSRPPSGLSSSPTSWSARAARATRAPRAHPVPAASPACPSPAPSRTTPSSTWPGSPWPRASACSPLA